MRSYLLLTFYLSFLVGVIYGQDGFPTLCGKKLIPQEVEPEGSTWPWIASIYKKTQTNDTSQFCGGFLITQKHVLTSAACAKKIAENINEYFVRFGAYDLNHTDDSAITDIDVRRAVPHEEFSPRFGDDIGIVELQDKVPDKFQPICLPLSDDLANHNFENDEPSLYPWVAGWGVTKQGGDRSYVLEEFQLPVVSEEFCRNAYEKVVSKPLDQRVICAGNKEGGNKDACGGFSGMPLMYPQAKNSETKYYAIGIVSRGLASCGELGYPGIYTRVSQYIPWITAQIQTN